MGNRAVFVNSALFVHVLLNSFLFRGGSKLHQVSLQHPSNSLLMRVLMFISSAMSSKDGPSDIDPRELCCPLPFAELMALDPVPEQQQNITGDPERIERFRSQAVPFPPGEGFMAFGGHVYAQSAYAASRTVERGFFIHVTCPLNIPKLSV